MCLRAPNQTEYSIVLSAVNWRRADRFVQRVLCGGDAVQMVSMLSFSRSQCGLGVVVTLWRRGGLKQHGYIFCLNAVLAEFYISESLFAPDADLFTHANDLYFMFKQR